MKMIIILTVLLAASCQKETVIESVPQHVGIWTQDSVFISSPSLAPADTTTPGNMVVFDNYFVSWGEGVIQPYTLKNNFNVVDISTVTELHPQHGEVQELTSNRMVLLFDNKAMRIKRVLTKNQ